MSDSETINIADFKVLSFDCYGTLIDWEAGILAVLRPWAEKSGIAAGDEGLLRAFAVAEAEMERVSAGVLYRDVLRRVMGEISFSFRIEPNPGDAETLAASVGAWPPFADTIEALRSLRQRFRLAVISNVDHASFAGTDKQLGVDFDLVVTAEDAGAYKPDKRPFLLAFEHLEQMGIARGEILHAAQSLFHDHVPAKELGLRTVWVNRRKGKAGWGATPPPDAHVEPDLVVADLEELAALGRRG